MIDRARSVAFLLSVVLIVVACVPTPAGRRPPGGGGSPSSATAAPITQPPAPSPTGPTPRPSFVRPTPTPLPTFFVHLVRAGDTLSSIASTYATTRLSIAFWNRTAYPSLDPESADYAPNRIVIGWTLRLIPNVEIDEEELLQPTPGTS